MSAFVRWDFWEGAEYSPITAMIRSDWTLKPNGQVWIDTTQQLWHTDATGTSWQGGQFAVRGYQGTYSVTVTYAGQTVTVPVTLVAGGSSVPVTLPLPLPPGGIPVNDNASPQPLDPGVFVFAPQVGGAALPLSAMAASGNDVPEGPTTFGEGRGGSLADGNGAWRTDVPKVDTAAGASRAADRTDAFFRLYGDANGDRTGDGLGSFLLHSLFNFDA